MSADKQTARIRRARRTRRRLAAARAPRVRLSVFRSLKHIYAQLIDDASGKTLAAATSLEKAAAGKSGQESGKSVGALIAERGKKAGVDKVRFDRGSYLYHGRIKALAEAAREGGLEF